EFGGHEHERQRLLTALGAGDCLPGFGRRERSERGIDDLARVGPLGDALSEIVGDVEPLTDAIDPVRLVVGKPFGADGRHIGSPSSAWPRTKRSGALRAPAARTIATTHSPGRLSLLCSPAQASSAMTSALAVSLRLPSLSRKTFASRSTSSGG